MVGGRSASRARIRLHRRRPVRVAVEERPEDFAADDAGKGLVLEAGRPVGNQHAVSIGRSVLMTPDPEPRPGWPVRTRSSGTVGRVALLEARFVGHAEVAGMSGSSLATGRVRSGEPAVAVDEMPRYRFRMWCALLRGSPCVAVTPPVRRASPARPRRIDQLVHRRDRDRRSRPACPNLAGPVDPRLPLAARLEVPIAGPGSLELGNSTRRPRRHRRDGEPPVGRAGAGSARSGRGHPTGSPSRRQAAPAAVAAGAGA